MKRSVVDLYVKVCDIHHARAAVESTRARAAVVDAESGVACSTEALDALEGEVAAVAERGVSGAQLMLINNERATRRRAVESARERLESTRDDLRASDARLQRSRRTSKRAQTVSERIRTRRHREGIRREQRELDDLGARYASKDIG